MEKNCQETDKGINVLSLFDGMSCGMIALDRAGIKVNKYYASEIDKHAIEVSKSNYPKIEQLGDIFWWRAWNLQNIDLIIGGSPCQDISNLNVNSRGLDGSKSSLFYCFYDILREYNPKNFLLENVVGNKKAINEISKMLNYKNIKINSKLLSAQKRNRIYWTDIPNLAQPNDNNILLKDILQASVDKKYFLRDGRLKWFLGKSGQNALKKRFINLDGEKSQCLTARGEASWNCHYITDNNAIRKLTPVEWERLQTVNDDYTSIAKEAERYKMLGNGWTVDVIAHIFKGLKGGK